MSAKNRLLTIEEANRCIMKFCEEMRAEAARAAMDKIHTEFLRADTIAEIESLKEAARARIKEKYKSGYWLRYAELYDWSESGGDLHGGSFNGRYDVFSRPVTPHDLPYGFKTEVSIVP